MMINREQISFGCVKVNKPSFDRVIGIRSYPNLGVIILSLVSPLVAVAEMTMKEQPTPEVS